MRWGICFEWGDWVLRPDDVNKYEVIAGQDVSRERLSGEGEPWELTLETKENDRKSFLPRIRRKRDQNKMKQLWKKVLFPFPSPAGKQILEKDHFAMQTRLNLRRQLFRKITEELFIFYFSLLSMNQCSKKNSTKMCGVYGLCGLSEWYKYYIYIKNLKSYEKCLEILRTLDSKNMKTILQGKKII